MFRLNNMQSTGRHVLYMWHGSVGYGRHAVCRCELNLNHREDTKSENVKREVKILLMNKAPCVL